MQQNQEIGKDIYSNFFFIINHKTKCKKKKFLKVQMFHVTFLNEAIKTVNKNYKIIKCKIIYIYIIKIACNLH